MTAVVAVVDLVAVVTVVDLVAVLFLGERYQVPTQTNTQKSSPISQCKSRTAVLIMCLLQGGECPRQITKRYLFRQNAAKVLGPFRRQAFHFVVLLDGHTSLRVPTIRQRLAHVAILGCVPTLESATALWQPHQVCGNFPLGTGAKNGAMVKHLGAMVKHLRRWHGGWVRKRGFRRHRSLRGFKLRPRPLALEPTTN